MEECWRTLKMVFIYEKTHDFFRNQFLFFHFFSTAFFLFLISKKLRYF
jgi:hypothetical protein